MDAAGTEGATGPARGVGPDGHDDRGAVPDAVVASRRLSRWVLGLIAATLVLLGATVWLAHRHADAIVARARTRLDADLATLAAVPRTRPPLRTPTLPGDAFDEVDAAVAELLRPDPALGSATSFRFPPLGGFAAYLDARRGGLERLRASERRAYAAPPPWALDGPAGPRLHRQDVTDAQSVTHNAAAEYLAAGRADDALRCALPWIVLGADEQRSLGFPWVSSGIARSSRARSVLRDVLAHAQPGAAALAEAAEVLDGLEAHAPAWADVLLAEQCAIRRTRLELVASPGERSSSVRAPVGGARWLWSERLFQAALLEEELAYDDACLPPLRTPSGGWAAARRAIEEAGASSSDPMASFGTRGTVALVDFAARLRTDHPLDRVAVALAWYRAERGVLPATLGDLVPRHLASVPTCPETGLPLRYDRTRGLVWAPGYDGDDDGGRPRPDVYDLAVDGDEVRALFAPRASGEAPEAR